MQTTTSCDNEDDNNHMIIDDTLNHICDEEQSPIDYLNIIEKDIWELIIIDSFGYNKNTTSVSKQWYRLIKRFKHWFFLFYSITGRIRSTIGQQVTAFTTGGMCAPDIINETMNIIIQYPYIKVASFIGRIFYYMYNPIIKPTPNSRPRYISVLFLLCIRDYIDNHKNYIYAMSNFNSRDVFINYTKKTGKYILWQKDILNNEKGITSSPRLLDDRLFYASRDRNYNSSILSSVVNYVSSLFYDLDIKYMSYLHIRGVELYSNHLHSDIFCYYNNSLVVNPNDNKDDEYTTELNKLKDVSKTLFKMFLQFHHDHIENKFKPYRLDWTIYDEETMLCDTLDVVYQYVKDEKKERKEEIEEEVEEVEEVFSSNKKHVVIMDWKYIKNMKFEDKEMRDKIFNGKKKKYAEHLTKDILTDFTLQLSLYKYILEKHYNLIVDAMYVILLHQDNSIYVMHEIIWNEDTILPIIENRRKMIQDATNDYAYSLRQMGITVHH